MQWQSLFGMRCSKGAIFWYEIFQRCLFNFLLEYCCSIADPVSMMRTRKSTKKLRQPWKRWKKLKRKKERWRK